MDAIATAVDILDGIGGKGNVESLTYCATRLRFVLKDDDQVDDARVREAGDVVDTFFTKGQYQIVLGTDKVKAVNDELVTLLATEVAFYTKEKAMAMAILDAVGGQNNLGTMAYCATRLRIELKDFDKIDDARVRQIGSVKDTFHTHGQYQIILGNELVKQVYDEFIALVQQPVLSEKRTYSPIKR